VKGRHSQKWGPPKGHSEGKENNLETAIRETEEETGYKIQLRVGLLPHIIINKIKFFCLMVPKMTKFHIHDRREIMAIKWFNMDQLMRQVTDDPKHFNGAVRGLFDRPGTLKIIYHKVTAFKVNYHQTSNHFLNIHFKAVIDYLRQIQKKNSIEKKQFHYMCFYIIQKIYKNTFTNNDLITFVRNHLSL
jgi:hypothetical protein